MGLFWCIHQTFGVGVCVPDPEFALQGGQRGSGEESGAHDQGGSEGDRTTTQFSTRWKVVSVRGRGVQHSGSEARETPSG